MEVVVVISETLILERVGAVVSEGIGVGVGVGTGVADGVGVETGPEPGYQFGSKVFETSKSSTVKPISTWYVVPQYPTKSTPPYHPTVPKPSGIFNLSDEG